MSLLADHYLGGFWREHPYGNLQPLPTPVNDRHRAVFPFRSAKDLNGSALERMKRIEDLDLTIFWTQGIVGVGVIIPMSTACLPPAASLRITPAGSPHAAPSFFPSRCSAVSSAASLSPDSRPPFMPAHSSSMDISYRLPNRAPSPCGCGYCSATTGSSTPNRLSAGQNMCCAISAPTPTALPFPTPGWLLSPRAT